MSAFRLSSAFAFLAAALLLTACLPAAAPRKASPADYWPTTGWRTGTPEEQDIDSAKRGYLWLNQGVWGCIRSGPIPSAWNSPTARAFH